MLGCFRRLKYYSKNEFHKNSMTYSNLARFRKTCKFQVITSARYFIILLSHKKRLLFETLYFGKCYIYLLNSSDSWSPKVQIYYLRQYLKKSIHIAGSTRFQIIGFVLRITSGTFSVRSEMI